MAHKNFSELESKMSPEAIASSNADVERISTEIDAILAVEREETPFLNSSTAHGTAAAPV